jgi:hypothetical protein
MPSKLLLATSIPLVPLTCTALYLTYIHYRESRKGIHSRTTPHLQSPSLTPYLPKPIQENKSKYILHHEVAHASVPISALSSHYSSSLRRNPQGEEEDDEHEVAKGGVDLDEVLTEFLRHTMTTFSTRAPPAYAIRRLLKNSPPDVRTSFESRYLRTLGFNPGDRVCGVYVVSSRSPERVVLDLDAPEGYSGPVVEGLLAVEVEVDLQGEVVRFRNHTVMWREKGGAGPANVLDSVVGRWVHGNMVRWIVESGVDGVVGESKKGKNE